MEFGENGAVITDKDTNKDTKKNTANIHAFPDGPRSLAGLYPWVVYALTGYMIVELFGVAISAFLVWLYLPSTIVPFDLATLETIDLFILTITIAQFVLFVVGAVLVARITFRAMRNLYTVGSDIVEMSPGWTVGWYFIPIANWFKPVEGVSQIMHGTRKAIGEKPFVATSIPLWWTFWLLTNLLATIANQIARISGAGIDATTQITAFSFDGASSLFGILSAWALMRVLKPIVQKQESFKHGGVAHVFD